MEIRPVGTKDWDEWLRLRADIWPHASLKSHIEEMKFILADPLQPVFVAVRPDGRLGGLLEASLRNYAEGCETHPVGYIEGWYVDPDLRRQGAGKALVRAAEVWARGQGCREMASDCLLDNEGSLRAHLSLGYEEVERLIHFRRDL